MDGKRMQHEELGMHFVNQKTITIEAYFRQRYTPNHGLEWWPARNTREDLWCSPP